MSPLYSRRLVLAGLFAGLCLLAPRVCAYEEDPVAGLIKALKDDNALVRKRAAVALGRLGAGVKEALGALAKAAEDDDADVRAAAKAARARLDEPAARDALMSHLADPKAKTKARVEACKELAERFGHEPAVARLLESLLSDAVVKAAAARGLDVIDAHKSESGSGGKRRSSVAVVNLAYVLRNYQKATESQEKFRALYKEYEWRVQRLNRKLEAANKEMMQGDLKPAQREDREKEVRTLQRQVQDLSDEARRTLGAKQGATIVELYKEVDRAVSRYAREHDLDLVLQYNDAVTEAEANSPPAIERRVGGPGCCLPLYVRSKAVDISDKVLAILNDEGRADAK
jgi:Skp family chaperone for outer membrane proteins